MALSTNQLQILTQIKNGTPIYGIVPNYTIENGLTYNVVDISSKLIAHHFPASENDEDYYLVIRLTNFFFYYHLETFADEISVKGYIDKTLATKDLSIYKSKFDKTIKKLLIEFMNNYQSTIHYVSTYSQIFEFLPLNIQMDEETYNNFTLDDMKNLLKSYLSKEEIDIITDKIQIV